MPIFYSNASSNSNYKHYACNFEATSRGERSKCKVQSPNYNLLEMEFPVHISGPAG